MTEQGGPNGPGGQQEPVQHSGAGQDPQTAGQPAASQQGWQPGQQAWQPPTGPNQGPAGQQRPSSQQGWQPPNAASGPQYGQREQYGQPPTGQANWQQPQPGSGPQGWQPPPAGHNPAGTPGWQQPGQQNPTGAPAWQQPGQPTGPQSWQQPGSQPGQPVGPWSGPVSTQGYPTQGQPGPQGASPWGPNGPNGPNGPGGPGGPGQWTGQQPADGPQKKNNKPLVITAIAVVIALVAAVGVYFLAIRDTNTTSASGNATPQEAVQNLFTTLGNSDPIGVADQLDPAESALFTDLNSDVITELKRLDVLSDAASADSMTGTTISVSGVTYDPNEETINDNVHIVKLTGGTITVNSDPSKIPLSQTMTDAFGSEIDQAQPESQTVNIADAVAENDGEPIRVATVQRDGKWYVSVFYSIADNAVHAEGLPNPTAADVIEAKGYASPEEAADALVKAGSTGDLRTIIAMLPPDEMGVMHDYGQLILDQSDASSLSSDASDLGVSFTDVTWATSEVTGGTKVSLASATVTAEGQTVTMSRNVDEGSITISAPGQPEVTLDENSIDGYIAQAAGDETLDPQMVDLIKR
ncbi:MAG: hypothetical protein ABWZ02_10475, partial [Nakamurella sp.]